MKTQRLLGKNFWVEKSGKGIPVTSYDTGIYSITYNGCSNYLPIQFEKYGIYSYVGTSDTNLFNRAYRFERELLNSSTFGDGMIKVDFDESLFDDHTVKFINGSFFKPMGHSAAHLIREYVKPRVNMRRNEEGNREYSFPDFDWKFVSGTASQFIDTGLLEKHIIECTQPFFNTQYRDPYLLSMRDALLNQHGTLFGSQDLLETYVEKHKAICEENIKKYGQKFFWI